MDLAPQSSISYRTQPQPAGPSFKTRISCHWWKYFSEPYKLTRVVTRCAVKVKDETLVIRHEPEKQWRLGQETSVMPSPAAAASAVVCCSTREENPIIIISSVRNCYVLFVPYVLFANLNTTHRTIFYSHHMHASHAWYRPFCLKYHTIVPDNATKMWVWNDHVL